MVVAETITLSHEQVNALAERAEEAGEYSMVLQKQDCKVLAASIRALDKVSERLAANVGRSAHDVRRGWVSMDIHVRTTHRRDAVCGGL